LSKNAQREEQELKIYRNKYLSNNNNNHLAMKWDLLDQQVEIKDRNLLLAGQVETSSLIWWLVKRLQDKVLPNGLNQALPENPISKHSSTMTLLWINSKDNLLWWIVSSFKTLVVLLTFLSIRLSLKSNWMLMHNNNLAEKVHRLDAQEWIIQDQRMQKGLQAPIKD
jgi:hypothetical protein